MKKLKEYRVYASETIFYEKVVKAKDEEAVNDLLYSGNLDFTRNNITDSANFELEKIELETK